MRGSRLRYADLSSRLHPRPMPLASLLARVLLSFLK
jgi:hypothetical protein